LSTFSHSGDSLSILAASKEQLLMIALLKGRQCLINVMHHYRAAFEHGILRETFCGIAVKRRHISSTGVPSGLSTTN